LVGQVLDRTRRSERYIAVRELSADAIWRRTPRTQLREDLYVPALCAAFAVGQPVCWLCSSGDYNPMTSKGRDEAREAYVQLGWAICSRA
jgi:hypothetical protein